MTDYDPAEMLERLMSQPETARLMRVCGPGQLGPDAVAVTFTRIPQSDWDASVNHCAGLRDLLDPPRFR